VDWRRNHLFGCFKFAISSRTGWVPFGSSPCEPCPCSHPELGIQTQFSDASSVAPRL
jgi:hypothetical protein